MLADCCVISWTVCTLWPWGQEVLISDVLGAWLCAEREAITRSLPAVRWYLDMKATVASLDNKLYSRLMLVRSSYILHGKLGLLSLSYTDDITSNFLLISPDLFPFFKFRFLLSSSGSILCHFRFYVGPSLWSMLFIFKIDIIPSLGSMFCHM